MSALDIIKGAKRARREERICFDGPLAVKIAQARLELTAALGKAGKLNDAEAAEIRQRLADMEAEAESSTVTFVLEAMPTRAYNALLLKHPPRKGNDGDRAVGVNQETFYPALVHASLVEPVFSASEFSEVLDNLSDGQLARLATLAHAVNREDATHAPFSARGSRQVTA